MEMGGREEGRKEEKFRVSEATVDLELCESWDIYVHSCVWLKCPPA